MKRAGVGLGLFVAVLAACGVSSDSPESGESFDTYFSDEGIDTRSEVRSCTDDRTWIPGPDGATGYADFVQLDTGRFLRAEANDGVLDRPDLGRAVAEVCVQLSAVASSAPFDIAVGDAAYLEPGTKLREIVGADPSLRVGAVVDGRVLIYEVSDPPGAVTGAQVLDLGSGVDEIALGRGLQIFITDSNTTARSQR